MSVYYKKTTTLKCKQGTEVTEAILRAVEGTNYCCQLMRISRQVGNLVLLLDEEASLPRVTCVVIIMGHLKS